MAKEKDFISPVEQFFDKAEETTDEKNEDTPADPAELDGADTAPAVLVPPEGYRVDPRFIEKKSQRVQLVMQPSLYKRAQKAAKKQKISFNELIHQLLNEYLTEFEKESKKK